MDNETIIKLVADALNCKKETIDINSGIGKHPNWDSLGQVSIMAKLESSYNIEINIKNVENLTSIKKIVMYLNNL